ncbi:rho family-interacting cell polarization regulator 1-like isoform X2 [Sphaeramia orbicularis]|nr:rho family-interacting cell polarization regulator 1 isoform X2 [Sphaeramia orbicularis]
MSLSVRPVRRFSSKPITRSQSFTGVNSNNRSYRNLSVFSTPGLNRKPSRASRMFTMSNKSNPPPKVPQPERLDKVYQALKKGLQSYLQAHQMDLDNLNRQMKESKRNSRLGFLYELDKQVKLTERFIRRLEFHLSKIEELYEAYCLQRRLRDGANKMVKAFTASPTSKDAKESLAEASKGYKEYTENMCILESELENQLGEFRIKMNGLAGFARLCAGDQYEIFMKYGRQRWKLRGRIEINAKQVWDGEEMVFLPLINEFLCVKVTELKSLANHVVVGSISCETKDLFAALPQTVAVDINDLGTIKLSLEVTWNPFDKDDQGSVASTVTKAPSISKRFSTIFNQSPPDTPSLREQAFYNMLQRHDQLDSGRAWSNSSESSDDSSSPQLTVGGTCSSAHHKSVLMTQELQSTVTGSSCSQSSVSICPRHSVSSTPDSVSAITERVNTLEQEPESSRAVDKAVVGMMTQTHAEDGDEGKPSPMAAVDETVMGNSQTHSYSRSLSHISESSIDDVMVMDRSASKSGVVMSLTSGISINDIALEIPIRAPESPSSLSTRPKTNENRPDDVTTSNQQPIEDTVSQRKAQPQLQHHSPSDSADGTYVARWMTVEEETEGAAADGVCEEGEWTMNDILEDVLMAVMSSLGDYRGQFPELQLLEQELKLLHVTLKGGRRSPSVVSLTVETALGSFDFLNTSDWEEEEEERSEKGRRNDRSVQGRGWKSSSPLTTGCSALDRCLVVHLQNCSSQLLRLGVFGPLRCAEMYALDTLLREARVLGMIRHITKENPWHHTHPAEVIPQLDLVLGAVSLWQRLLKQGSVYSVSVDTFLSTLTSVYSNILPERTSNMADTVFLHLAERVLGQRLPQRRGKRDKVIVTLFQLWSYLEVNGVSDMERHITELAEEVWLVQSLASCDQDVIVHTLQHSTQFSLRREGLRAVAKLLKEPQSKVSASASSVLRNLTSQPRQREQALVSCLELLEDEDVETRVCGCKALGCLKAKESIEQLVYLCRTDKEEVRDAAKQSLLVFGEEGRMAHRHVEMSQDTMPRLFAPGSMASTAF